MLFLLKLRLSAILAVMPLTALATSAAHAQCEGKIVVNKIQSMPYRETQIYQAALVNKSSAPITFRLSVLNPPSDFVSDGLPVSIRLGVGTPVARNLGRGGVHNFSLSNVKIVYDNHPAPGGFAVSITGCPVT